MSSTDRCNTFCELLSRRLIEQGLSRPFIELACDGTGLRLGKTVFGLAGAATLAEVRQMRDVAELGDALAALLLQQPAT